MAGGTKEVYIKQVYKTSPIFKDPEAKKRVVAGAVLLSVNGVEVSTTGDVTTEKSKCGKEDCVLIFDCDGGKKEEVLEDGIDDVSMDVEENVNNNTKIVTTTKTRLSLLEAYTILETDGGGGGNNKKPAKGGRGKKRKNDAATVVSDTAPTLSAKTPEVTKMVSTNFPPDKVPAGIRIAVTEKNVLSVLIQQTSERKYKKFNVMTEPRLNVIDDDEATFVLRKIFNDGTGSGNDSATNLKRFVEVILKAEAFNKEIV